MKFRLYSTPATAYTADQSPLKMEWRPPEAVFPAEELLFKEKVMNKPLMAKATAVWLVDNTTLSFSL